MTRLTASCHWRVQWSADAIVVSAASLWAAICGSWGVLNSADAGSNAALSRNRSSEMTSGVPDPGALSVCRMRTCDWRSFHDPPSLNGTFLVAICHRRWFSRNALGSAPSGGGMYSREVVPDGRHEARNTKSSLCRTMSFAAVFEHEFGASVSSRGDCAFATISRCSEECSLYRHDHPSNRSSPNCCLGHMQTERSRRVAPQQDCLLAHLFHKGFVTIGTCDVVMVSVG